MFSSKRLGRVGGIDLFIHPTFFLLIGFVLLFQGGLPSALILVAAFGCVLLHELGHAYAARIYGIPTRDITLYPIGGVARLERMPKGSGPELVIALAGPLVNFVLAGVFTLLPRLFPILNVPFLQLMVWINLVLGGFNLIPAFPMDGGRILRALLAAPLGRLRATEIAASVGQTLALALPLVLLFTGNLSFWNLFVAGFVYMAAGVERAAVRLEAAGFPPHSKRDATGPGFGQSSAPPDGYKWVRRGPGLWQLEPVLATADR